MMKMTKQDRRRVTTAFCQLQGITVNDEKLIAEGIVSKTKKVTLYQKLENGKPTPNYELEVGAKSTFFQCTNVDEAVDKVRDISNSPIIRYGVTYS